MKRVCFLIGNINLTGGTERVTSIIANRLCKEDQYEVSILSLSEGMQPAFPLDPRISLFSLSKEKRSMKKMFFLCLWKIRQFIIHEEIDTLVVVDSISCVFTVPALIGLSVKHICWEHFNFINNNGSKYRDFGRKLAAKYCDIVVTLTLRDTKLWIKGLGKISANMVCIPNPSPYEIAEHTPSKEFKIILAVGRLRYVKGFDLLLKAWAIVCSRNKDWILKIAGDGEEAENLKGLAQTLQIQDRIEFLGSVRDMTACYKNSTFLCLSSRNEGFPMVMLEAQSFGLPIVAFDCETGPSDIIKNNINGVLCGNGDILALSNGILKIINLDDLEYGKYIVSSKENSLNFKIDKIIKLWESIL